jgi:hypothetical protein|tara:strand:- start:2321 stop:2728 length:408 start_codon:yes stop_codon:yes gene_type:complete
MGLDQYAYAVVGDEKEELTTWRKHNRLHGWMEQLWEDKGRPSFKSSDAQSMGDFNCQPVELTESDIEQLEAHVENKALPETGGFFFGDDSFDWESDDGKPFKEGDYYYKEDDVEFISLARKALQEGKKVFYDSWW